MTGDNRPEPRVVCFGAILAAATVFYAVFVARTGFYIGDELFFTLFDDAMISMGYAKNLAGGYGLVWNPGLPPVEGYTNFLWTLWMALVHLLPIAASKYSLVIMVTGAALLLANVIVARSLVLELVPRRGTFAELYVSLSVAFLYPLIFWTLRGLEVGLLALLVDAALLTYFRLVQRFTRQRAVLFLALLCMISLVREDALVSAVLLGLYGASLGRRTRRLSFVIAIAAALMVSKGLHLLFRLEYYGELVPNTYYLKMTGVSVADRVHRGLTGALATGLRQLFLPMTIVLLRAAMIRWTSLWRSQLLLPAALFAGNVVYSVYVGGDAWEWMDYPNRFICVGLTPLIVLTAVAAEDILRSWSGASPQGLRLIVLISGIALAVQGMWDLSDKWHLGVLQDAVTGSAVSIVTVAAGVALAAGSGVSFFGAVYGNTAPRLDEGSSPRAFRKYWLTALLVVVTMSGRSTAQWFFRNAQELELDQKDALLGVFLREATRADAAMAVWSAGATPYFADRHSIDLLGKNDPFIAKQLPKGGFMPGHNKWDFAYSIGQQKPDVVAYLWKPSPEFSEQSSSWGYDFQANGLFVRRDSKRVDWDRIRADWTDANTVASLRRK